MCVNVLYTVVYTYVWYTNRGRCLCTRCEGGRACVQESGYCGRIGRTVQVIESVAARRSATVITIIISSPHRPAPSLLYRRPKTVINAYSYYLYGQGPTLYLYTEPICEYIYVYGLMAGLVAAIKRWRLWWWRWVGGGNRSIIIIYVNLYLARGPYKQTKIPTPAVRDGTPHYMYIIYIIIILSIYVYIITFCTGGTFFFPLFVSCGCCPLQYTRDGDRRQSDPDDAHRHWF